MKKQFTKPEMKVITLRSKVRFLAGSGNPDPNGEGCAGICNTLGKENCTGFGSIKCPYNTDA